jgi:3-hydroxybutyryl-CoA dehydratase
LKLEIGMKATRIKVFSDEDIRKFAEVSGDTNAIHLDDEYAARSRFGKRIVHGMLTASVVSAILGIDFPGLGTVYLSQSLQFKAPVFIGDQITAQVELIKYREERRIATFRTTCTNQDGVLVLDGEAVVLVPEG